MHKEWAFCKTNGGKEPKEISNWARELDISIFLARLLWHRGITGPEEMDIFLDSGLRYLPSIENWKELQEAALVLAKALKQGEKVAVWGDYDVDGLTASVLVKEFLSEKGYSCQVFLPDRLTQGYGLNRAGLNSLAEQGVQVLLSVDCGISDLKVVNEARELGMKVILTDHHQPKDELPKAQAIVNPKVSSCPYPELAGVGVAFLLMAALNKKLPGAEIDVREYLDLVALGTLADLVKLDRPNRILVKNGLLKLKNSRRPGIYALKEVSGLPAQAEMDSDSISFSLAPRLNAAGRLGKVELALELLLCKDLSKARELAKGLDELNQKRRKVEDRIYKQALEQAKGQQDCLGLVLYDSNWNEGVVGIVASRITEAYNRPCLILTSNGECLKGSGRSVQDFDLYEGLKECSNLLQGFGGHRQAAGLQVEESRLEELKINFSKAVQSQCGEKIPPPRITLEARLGLDWIDYNFVKELELLQPFGPGNPEPLFCSKGLKVQKYKVFKNKHVFLELKDEAAEKTMPGKIWKAAERMSYEVQGKTMQFAFTPRFNNYNGMTSIDLQISDWKSLE